MAIETVGNPPHARTFGPRDTQVRRWLPALPLARSPGGVKPSPHPFQETGVGSVPRGLLAVPPSPMPGCPLLQELVHVLVFSPHTRLSDRGIPCSGAADESPFRPRLPGSVARKDSSSVVELLGCFAVQRVTNATQRTGCRAGWQGPLACGQTPGLLTMGKGALDRSGPYQ